MFDECRIAPQQLFYVINIFLNCLTLSTCFVYFAILSQRKVYILRAVANPGEGPWGPGLPLVFGPN